MSDEVAPARGHRVGSVDQAALAAAVSDLTWLAEEGALWGVAEIIRERRRHIEVHAYELSHDDGHSRRVLSVMAAQHASQQNHNRLTERFTPEEERIARSDEDYARTAGSLLAAELDRLKRKADASGS